MRGMSLVEIQLTRHHPYVKTSRGCRDCGQRKYHPDHLGAPPSLNVMGSGSQFTYQAAKKGLEEALALALEASPLPKGLAKVFVEGFVCFGDRRKRDQGNHRMLIEKALGDVLQTLGYIADDDWVSYEFGGLQLTYVKGENWTRLMLMPTPAVTEQAS